MVIASIVPSVVPDKQLADVNVGLRSYVLLVIKNFTPKIMCKSIVLILVSLLNANKTVVLVNHELVGVKKLRLDRASVYKLTLTMVVSVGIRVKNFCI